MELGAFGIRRFLNEEALKLPQKVVIEVLASEARAYKYTTKVESKF